MKVTKQKEATKFTPVTVSITFETEGEYESFWFLMVTNVSVPEVLQDNFGLEKDKAKTLQKIMGKVATTMG